MRLPANAIAYGTPNALSVDTVKFDESKLEKNKKWQSQKKTPRNPGSLFGLSRDALRDLDARSQRMYFNWDTERLLRLATRKM
jgi:hypothetical protein